MRTHDGIFSSEKIVELAKFKGLDCISLTDHDTFEGVLRAKKRAEELNVKFLIGAELSSVGVAETHILAYNVDISLPECRCDMQKIADMRDKRNAAIIDKLAERGINVNLDELKKAGTVGRAALAGR